MLYEDSYTLISLISFILLVINIPFGFIRSRNKKFTRVWGRCIYIPILISYIFRKSAYLSYSATPFFLFATLLGQILGGILSNKSLERYKEVRKPAEVRIQKVD
jgi:hypothetical protein